MTEVESHPYQVGVHPTHPANWYDTWDRHQSMSSTKGLRNAPGENNCFLNSAVQVFWHLDVFRRSFRRLNGHLCMGNSCIFCALKVIFTQLQFSDKSSLTPDTLRKALAETFANDQRFQLGHMHDAAECFENILQRIHYHIANDHSEDTCTANHCLPHRKFAMTVTEELVCSCGSSSKPLTFHELVHYISATSLVSQSNLMQEAGDELHPDRFGLLLRNASAMGDVRDCPGDCGKRVQIRRTLLNFPDVVNIGIVWDSERPSGEMITEVARSIGTTMLLPDVFHSVMCEDSSKLPRLQLVAMVCYYGKHYSTFVFHTKLKVWIYFDDATVKEIGTRWEHVVDKCCRGRYQPLLLYYTNPSSVPISTETAPTKKTMAPGYTSNSGTPVGKGTQKGEACTDIASHGQNKARRSLTPSTDVSFESTANQRSITPGPECHGTDYDKIKRGEHQRQPSFLFAVAGKSETYEDTLRAIPEGYQAGLRHVESVPSNIGRQGDKFYTRDLAYNNATHLVAPPNPIRPSDIPLPDQNPESVDTYTLSTRDQYRRPSINSIDPGNLPLTTNFSRSSEAQRKESFKKGKSKFGADVIRYQVSSGSGHSQSSSESDISPMAMDNVDGPLPQTSKPFSQQTNVEINMPPRHVRTRSQSLEDDNGGILYNNQQHRVVKPKLANLGNINTTTASTHTPVQSGLATLPRKKKGLNENVQTHPSESQSHFRQNSVQSESGNHSRQSSSQSGYRQSPVPNGYQTLGGKFPHNPENDRHSRQGSNTSYNSVQSQQSQQSSSSQDKSASETKEKRTRKKRDSETKSKQSSQAKIPAKQPQPNQTQKNCSQEENPEYVDDKCVYIDRKMVETILNHQKVHRQVSVTSHTSNSSIESDIVKDKKKGSLTVEIPFDTISLESQKDSGYGSSDRNSSSSAGSITMDPYTQYFMSRSMIPPKSIKPQNQFYAYHAEMEQSPPIKQNLLNLPNKNIGHINSSDLSSGLGKPPLNPKRTVPGKEESHHVYRTKLAAEHPPRKPNRITGTDSRLPNMTSQMMANKNHAGQYSSSTAAENNNGRSLDSPRNSPSCHPVQARSATPTNPPSVGPGPNGTTSPYPVGSPSATTNTNTNKNGSGSDFYNLCRLSEDLMDQCMLAEADGSCNLALQQCGKAVEYLQRAMRISGLGQISFDEVQKKHNSCLLKLRALQKRTSVRKESNKSPSPQHNCSMTSTDSESEPPRESYPPSMPPVQPQLRRLCQPAAAQPTKSNSRDSVESIKEMRNSGSNSSICSTDSVKQSGSSVRTQCHNSPTGESEKFDIYATLPRKGKKNALNRTSSNPCDTISATQNEKSLPLESVHVRTSSGSSTSTTTSSKEFESNRNSGSDARMPNNSASQKKMSKSDIRQLLEKNMIQRQQQTKQGPSLTSSQGQGHVHQPTYRVPPPYSQPLVPQATENWGSMPSMNKHLSAGDLVHNQRPAETGGTDTEEAFRPSVRDLASRFETSVTVDNSHEHIDTKTVKLTRKRSKSESSSRPKSVLARNKKAINNKPRKSVTFADQISLVSACDVNCRSGYRSDDEDLAYENMPSSYSDNDLDDDDTSTSVDSPVETSGAGCALCHKKGIEIGKNYCSKCSYYMSQFQPS